MAECLPTVHLGPTLGSLYIRALRRHPDRIAIIEGDLTWTYRQLEARAASFVRVFARAGLQPQDSIAQLSANRADAVAVIIAAIATGLRYTPLHPRAAALDHIMAMEDAGTSALVVDENAFPNAAEAYRARLNSLVRVFSFAASADCISLQAEAVTDNEQLTEADVRAEDVVAIFYTGGTTGRPKGVAHTHRSLVANTTIELAEFEWPDPLRFLIATPISHAGFAFLLPVLLRGGTIVLCDSFSPASFLDNVARHRITATFLVPTVIAALLDSPLLAGADIGSLALIVYGAAPISPARLSQAIRRFGPIFNQLFGQTEAPNIVCVLRKADHDLCRAERLASCGQPVAALEVKLLDDSGAVVAPGAVGEICVRGPLVMERYWNRPEETAEALAGGWLHTGDLAIADEEGYLTIVDRKKDLIISGGFNVYPREVEDVLASHPGVRAAVVIGVPDEKWGEAVKAYVVAAEPAPSAQQLKDHVKAVKGAVYAPKAVEFLECLPLTALGKPDRKSLRARHWGGQARQVN
jgi:fatty-acyl-CoA synthase